MKVFIMGFKFLLLGLCLVGSLDAAPSHAFPPPKCQDACQSKFKNGVDLSGCNTGCRLMSIEEGLVFGMQDLDSTKGRCQSQCRSSYGATDSTMNACAQGCSFMADNIKNRHSKVRDPFERFFGGDSLFNQIHLPVVFPASERSHKLKGETGPLLGHREEDSKERGMFGNFHSVMSNMNRLVGDIMKKFQEDGGLMGGNGKLVVIKSQPGHYETETYELSPQSNLNDMMSKINPLDDFFKARNNREQVEEETHKKDDNVYGVEFVNPLNNELRKEDDLALGPILPETGLKTRITQEDNICNRHPEYMTWYNYLCCVDRRISSSGWWIYICILPLACLLLLRICMLMAKREAETLVPLPMTLHKDVVAKAKEAEANASVISIVTIPDYIKNDLPPAYEDVTNLKVALVPQVKTEGGSPKEESPSTTPGESIAAARGGDNNETHA